MTDITGTFVDSNGAPLAGLGVRLWCADLSLGWVNYFSDVVTDAGGNFTLTVPIGGVLSLVLQEIATVEICVMDVVQRTLASSQFVLPLTGAQALGTIIVPAANIHGWQATNLDPAGTAPRVSGNNTLQPTIDNVQAWQALHAAVAGASKELALQLFYWDIGQLFLTFDPDPPSIGTPTTGTRLEDDLVTVNRSSLAVPVRVLIRDHSPLPYPVHTADPVTGYFAGLTPPTSIEVRRYPTDPRLPMHAKFVIIDGNEAHLTTSPLLQEYFDGQQHLVQDQRRGPLTSLGTVFDALGMLDGLAWPIPNPLSLYQQYKKNAIRVPVHDVGAIIRGDAVKDLYDTFFLHWNVVGTAESSTLTPTPPPAPVSTIQVVRSLPRATFPGLPEGEASILESYLRCFAQAQTFIYLENQYLTEQRIYDAIRLALKDNVARPNLQVIMLLNHKVDIPFYQAWQTSRLTQLIANLTEDGTIGRFGAFTLWTHDDTVTPNRIISTYVHTKAAVADDNWATAGSANLDGVSLMTGEHLAPIVWVPGMENRRATEVCATIVDGLDGAGASTVPGDLRRALWAEHLGLSGPQDPQLTTPPSGGWLSLWQASAAAKLNSLTGATPVSNPCRALPWQAPEDSEKYLKGLGVDVRKFEVLQEFPGFDFTTGRWQ